MSIDDTIKKMNTANILLDAFGDGHDFTMHDYEELAATVNELFGGRYGANNPCYSVSWFRDHCTALGVKKVGSREIEITISCPAYERTYSERCKTYFNKYVGRKFEPKTVKQFIYRMDSTARCKSVIQRCKTEISCEIDSVTARIKANQEYLEKLKKML